MLRNKFTLLFLILFATFISQAWGASAPPPPVQSAKAGAPPPHPVQSPPNAGFTVSIAPAVNQPVQFNDRSTGQPTAWQWAFGDGGTSTTQNSSHVFLTAGSYDVTLKVSNASGTSIASQTVIVSQDAYTLAVTLSDQAQLTTLAFDGLGMMTGNLDAQSFFPPGKVADYTGFQFLRDNDPDNMGHNTDFLTRVAA